MEWLGVIQAVGSVATAIGVFLAMQQLKLAHRQEKTQFNLTMQQLLQASEQERTRFEDKLTEQYRAIMADLPIEALLGLGLEQERLQRFLPAFYRYIDLCNEQAFLHQQGRISEATWRTWNDGMKSHLQRDAFKDAWEYIKTNAPKDRFEELRQLETEWNTVAIAP